GMPKSWDFWALAEARRRGEGAFFGNAASARAGRWGRSVAGFMRSLCHSRECGKITAGKEPTGFPRSRGWREKLSASLRAFYAHAAAKGIPSSAGYAPR